MKRGREGVEAALGELNAFFDHVFVITIERNTERRQLLEENLHGLEFTYIEGVDGSSVGAERLDPEYDDAAAHALYGRALSPGQIGCALSHRLAYEAVVSSGFETALILEDDAAFPESAAARVAPALEQLPADWDLLYLYAQRAGESALLDLKVRWLYPLLTRTGLRRYDMERVRATYSRPFSPNLRLAGKHWVALSYGVTRSTAARLLAEQTPVVTVADDALRRFSSRSDTRSFLAEPPVFLPRRGVDSTIWNRPQRAGVARQLGQA